MNSAQISISIAGWPTTLTFANGTDSGVIAKFADKYDAFRIDQPAGIDIQVSVEEGEPFIPPAPGPWQIRTGERDGHIEFESHFEKGWIDFGVERGALIIRPIGDPENFLRVGYAWRCLRHCGLLLHAAGVIRHGRGYVFFGHSGSGKSTISRLSLEHTVLSDDMVILKKDDHVWRVFGVPFRGDMPEAPRTNGVADLHGLYSIQKDIHHRIDNMTRPEGIGRLASCVPFVMEHLQNVARIMQICEEVESSVPARFLHFSRDTGFWSVIDGHE